MTCALPRRGAALLALLLMLLSVPQALTAQSPAGESVNLQPRYVTGRATRYSFWTQRDRRITATVGDQTRNVDNRMAYTGQITWTVQRVEPDGSAVCAMTIDWIALDITLPDGQVQHHDTREGRGDNETVYQHLAAVAALPVEVKMNPDGSAASIVAGVDRMRQQAGEGIEVPSELDFLESASDLATVPYALAQAAVGATWSTTFDWKHEAGQLHHETTYRFDGLENLAGIPVAIISGNARLSLTPDQEQMKELPPEANLDVRLEEGGWQTQVMFDLSRHEAVGRNTVQTTRISSTMTIGPNRLAQVVDEKVQSQVLRISE